MWMVEKEINEGEWGFGSGDKKWHEEYSWFKEITTLAAPSFGTKIVGFLCRNVLYCNLSFAASNSAIMFHEQIK